MNYNPGPLYTAGYNAASKYHLQEIARLTAELKSKPNPIFDVIARELASARAKFPDPAGLNAALMEEVGELSTALLDEDPSRIFDEAVQVAAVAIRIAIEGDPTLDSLREAKGLGPSCPCPDEDTP